MIHRIGQPKKDRRGTRHFTLVELLVSIAILVLLMALLFQILMKGQQAWTQLETNTRIYENARIALDLFTRDLQTAVAGNRAGKEIPFYIGTDAPSGTGASISRVMTAFVAFTGQTGSAESKMTEVSYTFDNGSLRRKSIQDHNNPGWDFYGDTSDAWVTTPSSPGFEEVIKGVDDLAFVFYDAEGDELTTVGSRTTLPAVVWVSITLYDPKLEDAPDAVKNRSMRTFTKTIYLRTQTL